MLQKLWGETGFSGPCMYSEPKDEEKEEEKK